MRFLINLFLLFTCSLSFAQQKQMEAVKAATPPQVDGQLHDAAWANAPVASGFIQTNPSYGQPATAKVEARVLYDNNGVYVSAYIKDDPAQVRKQFTARDGEQRQDVDYFAVLFDTYNDKQNGFMFLVTTKNVQTDIKLNPSANAGFGDYGDRSWDAVWDSRVSFVEDGWIVEMRIPYLSLRFPIKEVQTWGLQFLHYSRRNNESSYWNPVNPNLDGFINQFGQLTNLSNIEPPLRLSLSPYVSTGIRQLPGNQQASWLRSGGMDVKYGVNESFTIDATLIPDFGQVISDNLINNLSPFEVWFQENRPFFTEGTEIINKSGLFYSRRVGATPSQYRRVQNLEASNPNLEVIKNPSITQLYNAVKFSGRNNKKLGIGVFNAVTAPMEARVRNLASGKDSLIETEPLTNYNVFVLDQALKNRSSITFTNTNVIRNGAARDANVSAVDWSLFTKDNRYQLRGSTRYSKIFGYTPFYGNLNLINDTVRRNGRLYVNPYDGFSGSLRFAKVSGNLQFSAQSQVLTNGYDPNDLGFLYNANRISHGASISYVQPTATENFLMYRYSLGVTSNYLYQNNRYSETLLSASAFWWFKNFWDLSLGINSYPTTQYDYFDLRTPGYRLQRPAEATFSARGSTDSRKKLFVRADLRYAVRDAVDNRYNYVDLEARFRFNDRFSMTVSYLKQFEENQRGYSFLRNGDGTPVVGYRNYNDYQTIVSGIYNFTSRLNLTLRTRHYLNTLEYQSFYKTDKDGNLTPRSFMNGADGSYSVFNVDAFLTWDFRLGSRLIMGWKNWNGDPFAVANHEGYFKSLGQVLQSSHGNELTLRLVYFLDYNQLREKR